MKKQPARREKPLEEQLREATNQTTVRMVENGFRGIDHMMDRGVDELKKIGIHGTEELAASVGRLLKRAALRSISK